jgi:hypothetical protein
LTSVSRRNLLFFFLAVFYQDFARPGIMSSPSSNNGKEDAWLMKMELKEEGLKDVFKVDEGKEVVGDQAPAIDQALPEEEEEDILLPYYEHLTLLRLKLSGCLKLLVFKTNISLV